MALHNFSGWIGLYKGHYTFTPLVQIVKFLSLLLDLTEVSENAAT